MKARCTVLNGRLLVGDATTHEARVSAAMLTAAISGAVMHPFVAGLDDDTLRALLCWKA